MTSPAVRLGFLLALLCVAVCPPAYSQTDPTRQEIEWKMLELTQQLGQVRPPAPAEVKPGEGGTIEGLVVKSGSNEPIRRAQITLTRAGPGQAMRAYSDATGRFVFRELAPGGYVLTAERVGYVRQAYGQRTISQAGGTLRVAAGQTVRDVVFRMVPWAVISGRVFDEEGEPLVGASVEVLRFSYVRGRRQLQRSQMAGTNDLGEYRVYGLSPGRYYVSASYFPGGRVVTTRGRGGAPPDASQAVTDESYAPTYYPGTTDPARALPLELRGGQEVSGLDFALQLQPTVRVRGRIINGASGQPVRGAMVTLFPRESDLRPFFGRNQSVTDNPQGEFEIRGVIPGTYYLGANFTDQGRSMTARLPVDVGSANVEGAILTLAPGFVFEGRVRVEGGGELPVSNPVRIEGIPTAGGVSVRMTSVRVAMLPIDEQSIGVTNTSVRADGVFSFRDLTPGVYMPMLSGAPEAYYVKSAQLGGRNALEIGVDLTGGAPGSPLEIILSPNGARIEGVVVSDDQQAVPGAIVVLVPDPARRKQWPLYRLVTADTSGRFSIPGLAPGEYKLFAWIDVEPGAHMDPEFLRPYEAKGVVVRVEESGRYSQELKLLPMDTRLP